MYILRDFEGVGDEAPDPLSEELRKKFREALKGKLKTRECESCPLFTKEIVDFFIEQLVDAARRMDVAAQVMENFIEVFSQLEENLMKARMLGVDDL